MDNENTLRLMNLVKDIIPNNVSMVDELSDLLGISNDSIYRRMRGETSLTIDEVEKICKTFKISFDGFINNNLTSVTFDYNPLFNSEEGFEMYLRSILDDLKKIKLSANKNIIYAGKDIPLFHNFRFDELSAFKIFYWLRSAIDVPQYQGKKYSPELVPQNLLEVGREIYDTYTQVYSSEIWCDGSLVSLFKQIDYYWDSGLFANKNDALVLCQKVKEQLDFIQLQAENSSKILSDTRIAKEYENNFMLYYSEVEIGNNCIMVNIENNLTTYVTHNTFNKLITSNNSFCSETQQWLKNLMKKSTLISGASEKYRYQFFKKAYDLLNQIILKVEG